MIKQFSIIKKQRARAAYAPVSLEGAEPAAINEEVAAEHASDDAESAAEQEKTKGTCATLWHLKGNLIYMVCIWGLTCLYFIITNIQYWVTLYFIDSLGASTSSA